LQRLERCKGVVVLAANLQKNIDEAFTSRIDFSVHFPRPTSQQKVAIWERQLPVIRLDDDVSQEFLVRHHDLVGGEIRNCALRAASSCQEEACYRA